MKLSEHFSLEELLFSETAERLGQPVVAEPRIIENLTRLCTTLLEPIRVKLQRPMVVISGYRPLWLNLQVGGSATSAHMEGLAADIRVVGMSPATFCRWLQQNAEAEDWAFDQCILEFGRWTHLGLGAKPRMQYLTAKKDQGKTVYLPGIVE